MTRHLSKNFSMTVSVSSRVNSLPGFSMILMSAASAALYDPLLNSPSSPGVLPDFVGAGEEKLMVCRFWWYPLYDMAHLKTELLWTKLNLCPWRTWNASKDLESAPNFSESVNASGCVGVGDKQAKWVRDLHKTCILAIGMATVFPFLGACCEGPQQSHTLKDVKCIDFHRPYQDDAW